MAEKPKLAIYWAAACGGCEIAILNLHEKFLELTADFELFFCPCLVDTKRHQLEALPDGGLAVTLFNGAIRSAENVEMARLLRRKSRLLVAFGACAAQGGIPGLANLSRSDELLRTIYRDSPTVDNPQGVMPAPESATATGTLALPALQERVATLAQTVAIDYAVPGCPPEAPQIAAVMATLAAGAPLPPAGSVLGAGRRAVCHECGRVKNDTPIVQLRRSYEVTPETQTCLLEQGLLCLGPATRDGCGAPCPEAGMPCSGCYGPAEGSDDQGAAMIAALGSLVTADTAGRAQLPDSAGRFYKYSLPGSILGKKVKP